MTGVPFLELRNRDPTDPYMPYATTSRRSTCGTPRTTSIVVTPNSLEQPDKPYTALRVLWSPSMNLNDALGSIEQALQDLAVSTSTSVSQARSCLLQTKWSLYHDALDQTIEELDRLQPQRLPQLRAKKVQTMKDVREMKEEIQAMKESQAAIKEKMIRCVLATFRGLEEFSGVGRSLLWRYRKNDIGERVSAIRNATVIQGLPAQSDKVAKHLAKAILTHTSLELDEEVMKVIVKEAFSHPDLVLLRSIRKSISIKGNA